MEYFPGYELLQRKEDIIKELETLFSNKTFINRLKLPNMMLPKIIPGTIFHKWFVPDSHTVKKNYICALKL